MATKHFICDYDIEKKGKHVKSGQIQFARVNVSEDEDEDESFKAAASQYETGGMKLKRETFKEAAAVGKIPTDEAGNISGRPPIVLGPK